MENKQGTEENKREIVIKKDGQSWNWQILICRPEEDEEYYGTGIYLSCCPRRKDGTLDKGAAFLWDMRYSGITEADQLIDNFVQAYFCGDNYKVITKKTKYYIA